jgi:site-specific DNA-methyltransferase (adenine-specific)/modification methylase
VTQNRVETIGPATLYLGDCRDILPTLCKVDLVLTDPPYGIGEAAGKNKSRSLMAISRDYGNDEWDDAPPSDELIGAVRDAGTNQIIFGGNYFTLPPSSCWLVWDKENGETDFADCELAWTNLHQAVRRIRFRWQGMLQENMGAKERREHPTQKPVPVMRWALGQAKGVQTVLDPFMGSGTTGVACVELGKTFIGIEREPKYFDIACKRIALAVDESRQRLFSAEDAI